MQQRRVPSDREGAVTLAEWPNRTFLPGGSESTRLALLPAWGPAELFCVTHVHAPATPDTPATLLQPLAPGDEDPVIGLLKAGIPLTLLMDLAAEDLRSEEIYRAELSA